MESKEDHCKYRILIFHIRVISIWDSTYLLNLNIVLEIPYFLISAVFSFMSLTVVPIKRQTMKIVNGDKSVRIK